MPKTAIVQVEIDSDLKREAEGILADLGLTVAESITLFYRQVQLQRGLPFQVRRSTPQTRETPAKAGRGEEMVFVQNMNDPFVN